MINFVVWYYKMENNNSLDFKTATCYSESTIPVHHPTSYHLVAAVLLLFSTGLILTENTFCLVVLYKNTSARFPVRLFLASLATNDICIGLLMALPSTIAAVFDDWVLGCTFCDITATLLAVNITVEMLSLLLLSIDTYLIIKFPLRYHLVVTSTRAKMAVAVVWLLSFLQLLTNLLPLLPFNFRRYLFYDFIFFRCFKTNDLEIDYILFAIVIVFIILPFFITVWVYIGLLVTVKKQKMRQRVLFGSKRMSMNQKTNLKAVRTFLIVTLAFGMSNLPFATVSSISAVTLLRIPYSIQFISYLLLLSNSWLNFLVYYLRNESFRKTAQKLWRKHRNIYIAN